MSKAKEIGFKEKITRGNASFELRSSGHVIGGSTVLVESNNKKLFYTGDINLRGSRLLPPADLDIGEMDMVITESTYSQENQIPRKDSEKGLIDLDDYGLKSCWENTQLYYFETETKRRELLKTN